MSSIREIFSWLKMSNKSRSNSEILSKKKLNRSLAPVDIGLFSSGIGLLSSGIVNDVGELGEIRVSGKKVDSSAGGNTIG